MTRFEELVQEVFRKYYHEHHNAVQMQNEFATIIEAERRDTYMDVLRLVDIRLEHFKKQVEPGALPPITISSKYDELSSMRNYLARQINKIKIEPGVTFPDDQL